jgi:ribosomal protein S27AE
MGSGSGDERESGEDGPFFVTYTDESLTEQHGYYCSNCGSTDVSMDSTDRLECGECGNEHATRSSEAYDGSYL